jgi:hypothetical protein
MKRTCLLWVILFSIIFFSCDKEGSDYPEILKVGDDKDMIIEYYDTTIIGGYYTPELFNIDIDYDGIDDIQFESVIWGSPAIGQKHKSVIKSINQEVQFFGCPAMDTLFVYNVFDTISGVENEVIIYQSIISSCYRNNENDSIADVTPSFKLIPLQRDDYIDKNDAFKADTIILNNESHNYHNSFFQTGNDTVLYRNYEFLNDSYTFPSNEIRYIGYRVEKDSRLGWIKIGVFDRYKISIIESAIQK